MAMDRKLSSAIAAGHAAQSERRFDDACRYYRSAAARAEELGLSNTLGFAFTVLSPLAECYQEANEVHAALRCLEQARALVPYDSCNDKSTQIESARIDLNTGTCFAALSKVTESLASFGRALEVFERNEHPDGIIPALIHIAGGLRSVGQFAEGLTLLQRAETLGRERPEPKKNAALYTITANKSSFLHPLDRHEEALENDLAVLDLVERTHGSDSVEAARSHLHVGVSKATLKNLTGALESYSRAGDMFQKLGLSCSIESAALMYNIGELHNLEGMNQQALDHFERCLAIRRKLLPPDHSAIGEALMKACKMKYALGRDEEAYTDMDATIAIMRRSQVFCSGPRCLRKVREDGAPLDVCVKCRRTFYCSKACQTADWKREGGHKAECKALIAEATAEAAAAK